MRFFVTWLGPNYSADPLDKGCQDFSNIIAAYDFGKVLTNKGCRVEYYEGRRI